MYIANNGKIHSSFNNNEQDLLSFYYQLESVYIVSSLMNYFAGVTQ